MSSGKVKPDAQVWRGLYKTLIKRSIFDDSHEIEIRLPFAELS